MRIAIVGTGIAGNVAARRLRDTHEITVFEANEHIGGHTNTVDVESEDGTIAVDTGFIVFNDRTYPEFNRLLAELDQAWRPSVMSFSVQNERTGLQYNGSSLNGLFAQRANLARPAFLRMLKDIVRFNRSAGEALADVSADLTVGEYIERMGYSRAFFGDYLRPMAAAIWSAEPTSVSDMPLRFLVRFFQNHGLLQLSDRPRWRVIAGGSREYVRKLVAGHRDRIRLATPVESISRTGTSVQLKPAGGPVEHFDHVFLACHADEALRLLADASSLEREVLSAFEYQPNETVLHTDERAMPSARRAWAAWNYHVPADDVDRVTVTYNMNILQGIRSATQYCVTLNRSERIDPEKVLYRTVYSHPVINEASVAAQARHEDVNRGRRTSYCGAYWGYGFHEDGVVSALNALRHFEEEQRGELRFRRAG